MLRNETFYYLQPKKEAPSSMFEIKDSNRNAWLKACGIFGKIPCFQYSYLNNPLSNSMTSLSGAHWHNNFHNHLMGSQCWISCDQSVHFFLHPTPYQSLQIAPIWYRFSLWWLKILTPGIDLNMPAFYFTRFMTINKSSSFLAIIKLFTADDFYGRPWRNNVVYWGYEFL